MLYRSNDNDRVFEVAVYNAKVRQLTDENQSHPYLEPPQKVLTDGVY